MSTQSQTSAAKVPRRSLQMCLGRCQIDASSGAINVPCWLEDLLQENKIVPTSILLVQFSQHINNRCWRAGVRYCCEAKGIETIIVFSNELPLTPSRSVLLTWVDRMFPLLISNPRLENTNRQTQGPQKNRNHDSAQRRHHDVPCAAPPLHPPLNVAAGQRRPHLLKELV